MSTEWKREAFEQWARSKGFLDFERDYEIYHDEQLQQRWLGWMGAMLSAAPDAPGEPVAVRHHHDDYGWRYLDTGSGSDWLTRIPDAEPLYTHPAPAQPVVKVKALEWNPFRAETPFGSYRIEDQRGAADLRGREPFYLTGARGLTPSHHSSLKAARAAAQADYERRILSALEPSPSLSTRGEAPARTYEDGVRDGLRQAAKRATSFLVGDPANGAPLRSPSPHEIEKAIRSLIPGEE